MINERNGFPNTKAMLAPVKREGIKTIKKDIWKDEFSMYYQGGMDGGDFIILKFTAESGRYYSNFRSEDFEIG